MCGVLGLSGYHRQAGRRGIHAKDQVKIICRTAWIWSPPGPDKTKTIKEPFSPNSFPTVLQNSETATYDKKPADFSRRVCRSIKEILVDYFCHVRFLWRFALRRLRRLCFDILRRRFFLRFPMV